MKIYVNFQGQVLALNKNNKDGKDYYSMVVFIDQENNKEAGTLNIPETVATKIIVGRSYEFVGCWNDKYTSFYITGVNEINE